MNRNVLKNNGVTRMSRSNWGTLKCSLFAEKSLFKLSIFDFIATSVVVWNLMFPCCFQLIAADGPQLAIFVMNDDGSEMKQIVQVPNRRWHSSPSWSKDGTRILFHAYLKDAETADSHIFVVNSDGSGLKDLGQGCYANWSPDNQQILFTIAAENPDKEQAGIWVMNMERKEGKESKDRQWLCAGVSPVFAPDGSRFLFLSNHEGSQSIYVYDMIEGTPKKILQDPYEKQPGSACWSPDGKKVAFVDERNGHFELMIIDAQGSEKEQAVRYRGFIGGPIAWAPNSNIVLWSRDQSLTAPQRLQSISPDGDDGPMMLPNQDAGSFNFDPAWSSDNKRLAFVSDRPK